MCLTEVSSKRPTVVIVGRGFGGITPRGTLATAPVDVPILASMGTDPTPHQIRHPEGTEAHYEPQATFRAALHHELDDRCEPGDDDDRPESVRWESARNDRAELTATNAGYRDQRYRNPSHVGQKYED